MKNGLFNLIRGIAFCFILSIICLFGRIETKANSFELTSDILYNDFSKIISFDKNEYSTMLSRYCEMWNSSQEACIYIIETEDTIFFSYCTWESAFNNNAEALKEICRNNNYTYICPTLYLNGSGILTYYEPPSSGAVSKFPYYMKYDKVNSKIYTSFSAMSYNSWVTTSSKMTVLRTSLDSSYKYDSTLGYLDNCIRKCMNQVSCIDDNGELRSISDVLSDNILGINSSFNLEGVDGIDIYSWLDKTTSGKSFDSVEIYIYLYKEGSLVSENSFILNGYPLHYDVSWKSLDSSISCLDLLTRKYNYQIWFRPLSSNRYGDWVYFDCEYNRVSERIQCLVSNILNGDVIGAIDDFKLTVENCQFGNVQGDYNKPSDVPSSLIVPNVLYNGVYTQINKPTICDDDKDYILQQIPSSSTSYTEINNNITIIQNGEQSGDSLLDKIGDLFSFFKEFLQFLYNFINLLLSPLSFLPSWLKSLITMTIVLCLAIMIIKIIRG